MPLVSAVALSVNHVEGPEVSQRLEAAMVAEVLACTAEGISTSEAHAPTMKARLQAAHEREWAAILAERA